jgi:hypothetical protein
MCTWYLDKYGATTSYKIIWKSNNYVLKKLLADTYTQTYHFNIVFPFANQSKNRKESFKINNLIKIRINFRKNGDLQFLIMQTALQLLVNEGFYHLFIYLFLFYMSKHKISLLSIY